MRADAIHGNIGKLFRKTSTVATFDDFAQLCEKANNNIKTIILDLPFIYTIFKKARTRSSTKVKIPLTESIVESQFKKENSMLHYNESFLEESYTTVNFLQPSFLRKMVWKPALYRALKALALHNQNVTIFLTR